MARRFVAAQQASVRSVGDVTPALVTMAAWIRLDALPTGSLGIGTGIMSCNTGGGPNDKQIAVSDAGQFIWYIWDGGSTRMANGPATVKLGRWQYVVGTASASSVELFLDGRLQAATASGGATEVTAGKKLQMGGTNHGGSQTWFTGALARVAVWDVPLTRGEVARLYSMRGLPWLRPESLLGYWPLGFPVQERDVWGADLGGTLTNTSWIDPDPVEHMLMQSYAVEFVSGAPLPPPPDQWEPEPPPEVVPEVYEDPPDGELLAGMLVLSR